MICPHCKKEIKLERGEKQKLGMIKRASKGNHVSRVPFGYKWDYENKKIIPAQNYQEVEEIFNEFLQEDMKLTALAKKRTFSVNGLKKILKNFAYVGKVKFDGQIHNGNHKPIISSILFNKVQDKLERLKRKKNY
ncbi:recombinase family protein [Candidatus Pacearchaeota archaeon]|nr:recombinase family protein [Candidatus Pacearchaeota archaeon]